jgi:hypothetical protein
MAAHNWFLCINCFSFILNANSTTLKALINSKSFMGIVAIKPNEIGVGITEIAAETNHLYQPSQFLEV